MARTLIAFIALATLAFAPASALAATVSIRETGPRTVSVAYAAMPKGTVFSVEDAKGTVVKEARVPKEKGVKRIQLPKDLAAGTYTLSAMNDGAQIAKATFKVAYEAPTCKMSMSEKRAMRGDNVTLRWSSDNATRAKIFGQMDAKASGAERIALYQPGVRTFEGAFFGKGGVAFCKATIKVSE